MNFTCVLGIHKWEGCRCLKCTKTRDDAHDLTKDCERCARCGTSRQNAHEWQGCECLKCGKTRHNWSSVSDKCTRCGESLVRVSLFQMEAAFLKNRRVQVLFNSVRPTVGYIGLIDLEFESGASLLNVRIENESVVMVPSKYATTPVRQVGVPNAERQRSFMPMVVKAK
jgi:hypothetical protein